MAKKDQSPKSTSEKLKPTTINVDAASQAYKKLLQEEKKAISIEKLKSALNAGENFIRQTQRVETKKFNNDIIEELQTGLESIERIIVNPRTFIKEQAELVQVELAKKVSTVSIRHFATHSQFVRNINENNEVIPEKVLTIFAESDTAIYENRFIMTLIKRTLAFIETRANFIKEHSETNDSDLLVIHNKTMMDNVTYEIDTRIKVSVPSQNDKEDVDKNKLLVDKIEELKTRCQSYFGSTFMNNMKGAKDVSSPIHMTNMIVKNPDYHYCYEFWNLLEKYEELGVSYDVEERNQKIDKQYLDDISTLIANSVATINSHKVKDEEVLTFTKKHYTPEVIFDLEDETYMDGKFLYDAYPEAQSKKKGKLPLNPAEVRFLEDRLAQRLKNQRDVEKNVKKAINAHKDETEMLEAEKRLKRRQEVYDNYDDLVLEIKQLQKENAKLEKELEELKSKKKK